MAPLPAEMLFIDTSGRGGATTAGRDPSVRVFEDEYELGDELGRGAFGVVYTAYAKRSGEAYAVKCMHKKKLMQLSSNSLVRVKDEIRALTALQHPHIIRMHATFESEDQLHILMEKADGGELFDRIVACGAFEEEHARHVAYQLLDVLHFMHTRAVLHRDIKPENLLLTSETSWDIKVTDFGLIKILDEHLFSAEELDANDAHHGDRRATVCGSNTYMAPEMAWHMAYGPALDVYSAGVVIYILLSGGPPYDVGQTPHPASTQSIPLPAQLFGTVSADAKELLKCMLEPSPSRRVTAAAALSSRWFSDHAVKTNDAGTGVQESVRGASTSDEGDLLDMAELQEWMCGSRTSGETQSLPMNLTERNTNLPSSRSTVSGTSSVSASSSEVSHRVEDQPILEEMGACTLQPVDARYAPSVATPSSHMNSGALPLISEDFALEGSLRRTDGSISSDAGDTTRGDKSALRGFGDAERPQSAALSMPPVGSGSLPKLSAMPSKLSSIEREWSEVSAASSRPGRLSADFHENFRMFNEKRTRSRGASLLLLSSGNLPLAKQARNTVVDPSICASSELWQEFLLDEGGS